MDAATLTRREAQAASIVGGRRRQKAYFFKAVGMLWDLDTQNAESLGLGDQHRELQKWPYFETARTLWTMACLEYFEGRITLHDWGDEETSMEEIRVGLFLSELQLAKEANAGPVFRRFSAVVANQAVKGNSDFFLRQIPAALRPPRAGAQIGASFKSLLLRYWFSGRLCLLPAKEGLQRLRKLGERRHGLTSPELITFTVKNYRESVRLLCLQKAGLVKSRVRKDSTN